MEPDRAVHVARGQLAITVRYYRGTPKEDAARRKLRAALLSRDILEATTTPPELTDEQRIALAGLLIPDLDKEVGVT